MATSSPIERGKAPKAQPEASSPVPEQLFEFTAIYENAFILCPQNSTRVEWVSKMTKHFGAREIEKLPMFYDFQKLRQCLEEFTAFDIPPKTAFAWLPKIEQGSTVMFSAFGLILVKGDNTFGIFHDDGYVVDVSGGGSLLLTMPAVRYVMATLTLDAKQRWDKWQEMKSQANEANKKAPGLYLFPSPTPTFFSDPSTEPPPPPPRPRPPRILSGTVEVEFLSGEEEEEEIKTPTSSEDEDEDMARMNSREAAPRSPLCRTCGQPTL
ncbi:hypothetical protein B0T24DRAFT_628240 [Lasiosphaeria ovina]|uniref:Uncharacterized protein n=1 Tax=Lasiosphaeria ovina TaxID=92902 RepID=A0AAE0N5A7_9PEZI|nr:hypothetical protein B0T24DRAFT_628240 [Lasiosphaeria ovina]